MRNSIRTYTIGGLLILVAIVGFIIFNQKENKAINDKKQATSQPLIPVDSITHGHGLAVNVADSNKLYIATHHGLLVLMNEKDLYQIGEKKDDYMGFSPHPTAPNVFFTSGHPSFGGNLGFQKSIDGGFTWEKISNGVAGPVDFHAMAISPVNPNLMYGWYKGLQRSTDGGQNWEIVNTSLSNVISLAADTKNEDRVFAATMQGLMISENKGRDWINLSDDLKNTVVAAFAMRPDDSQKMLSFSEKLGFAKSDDSGKTWEKSNDDFDGDIVLYIAFSKQNPEIVYLLTNNNAVYKSINSGGTWSRVR